MHARAKCTRKRAVLTCALFLGLVSVITLDTASWASTKFGPDIEVQAWYRTRNTFQTDGKEHFDWVQWRNEAFIWVTYDNMVKNGNLFKTDIPIPFVHSAAGSVRFRARVDPVYYLREHYRNLYDANHRSKLFAPEKDFRDVYIDLDHGQVGPGTLSSRIGYQQIVWGESDLYRSLDIINPLRVDQNFAVGEKFDEFRLPILAAKFLYTIGNIGESFSEVGIEPWYTPRYRASNSHSHLIVEDGWRLQFSMRGCAGPNGQLLDYSPENCANSRKFLPFRPAWLGSRRVKNPWSITNLGPNARNQSPEFFCVTQRCAPDVAGDRASIMFNLVKGKGRHHTRGTDPGQWSAGGVRLIGKTWFNLDFSLNYIFQPTGAWGSGNPNSVANAKVFGDSPFLGRLDGSFEEGLRRCLSPSGKSNMGRNGQSNETTWLTGADLRGYDWPQRRLDSKGNPLPTAKQKQAARAPLTLCVNPIHVYKWSHVIGATATYNDFDYTGAVFRLEESVSTREPRNKFTGERFAHAIYTAAPVWRSMLGFDLASALGNYPLLGWTRNLPGQMGTTQSFLTFQWLMQYLDTTSNNTCSWNGAPGSKGSAPGEPGPVRRPIPRCEEKHWNHLFTLGSGGLYFRSRLEQRLAVVFEPRAKQWLLYGQWWWRDFLGLPVDLSMGTSWFLGSVNDNSWTILHWFNDRNLLWFEGTYYLL